MKYVLLLTALAATFSGYTQTSKEEDSKSEQAQIEKIMQSLPPCPKPTDAKMEGVCTSIDKRDFKFAEQLEEMACVDRKTDNALVVKAKVQRLWNTYYSAFYCDATGFSVENGNITKYSVFKNFPSFIDYVVKHYGLNINKPDVADGKTLLDYVQDEIRRMEGLSGQAQKVTELRNVYRHLKNDLGARHAAEL